MSEKNGSKPVEAAKATAEEFITTSPLFVRVDVDGFDPPRNINLDCFGSCQKETTWIRLHAPVTPSAYEDEQKRVLDHSIKTIAYRCLLCSGATLTVIYREMQSEKRKSPSKPAPPTPVGVVRGVPRGGSYTTVTTQIMKIGQYPAPRIVIPKGLEEALGSEAAALYRKALLSRNSGYGLAAVAYIRRVVEDKTNELIEVAAQYAESNGVEPETVASIRDAISPNKYTPYEDKLKIAATVFPENLRVGDVNPLQLLFRDVSEGLHGLSEERCIEIADEIRAVFEYVFKYLRAQVADRRAFVEKVKKLT